MEINLSGQDRKLKKFSFTTSNAFAESSVLSSVITAITWSASHKASNSSGSAFRTPAMVLTCTRFAFRSPFSIFMVNRLLTDAD
jgi:hypothetical protein